LTRVVAQLRKALGDDSKSPRYIETVATRGYRFVAEVRVAARPIARYSAATPAPAVGRRNPVVASGTVIMLAVFAMLAAGVLWAVIARTRRAANADAARASTAAALADPIQLTSSTGLDTHPALSPDGRSLAFSSDRSGALEIFVQSLAGGATATQLTSDGRHSVQPDWSPDGEFVAYHAMNGEGIWIVPSRGGVARQLVSFGSRPVWSPDGRTILFQSLPLTDLSPSAGVPTAISTLWTIDASGGTPRALTTATSPPGVHVGATWSADGRHVFFAVGRQYTAPGTLSIWSVNVATRASALVAQHDQMTPDIASSPDGRYLYFRTREAGAVWRLPLAGVAAAGDPEPTALPISGAGIRHLRLSRDGRALAWASLEMRSNIWAVDVAATGDSLGEPVALTKEAGARLTLPFTAPDGRVAFGGSKPGTENDVWVVAPGEAARQVTVDPADDFVLGWTPDGRDVVVGTRTDEGLRIAAVNPATRASRAIFERLRPVVPTGTAPFGGVTLAPDLGRLAGTLVGKGIPNIWIVDAAAGGARGHVEQITFEREAGTYPVWSPDAQWIAYQCAEQSVTHVCVVPSRGGPSARLTQEPGQSWVNGWSPDGDRIVFAERRSGIWNLASVSRTTGDVRRITHFTEPRIYVRYPAWAPAANRVAFERAEVSGRLWMIRLD
jgi:Tol biopolymer transport system component